MIENVTRALAAALPGCTAEEIADVLWLLTARDTRWEAAPVMPDGSDRPDLPPASPAEPAPHEAEDTEATQSELTLPLSGDSAAGGRMVPAIEVGLRSPGPATRSLSTVRALARFKRIHRPGPPTVDVEATVEATADARRLVVVTSPGRERGLDVALVVDSSLVMSVCRGELAEFEALLRRAGAFRSVTRWTLVPDPPPHQALGSRATSPGPDVMIRDNAGVEHHTDRLVDPSGRRLVLLATDAVADHWYRAGVWQAIQRWAQVMPTAIIDMLPEQYRAQTALGMPAAVMRSRRPAGPNVVADVQVAWWEADLHPEGDLLTAVPLPVVALRPQALEAWAEAIAAAGTAWVDAVWAQRPPGPSPSEANANRTAEDRVQAFLARASRDAQALARILAMAPVLTLPLIRVLQAGLLPGTGSSELAEVLVGGLIERVPGQADRNGPGQFRFRPAIREQLLRGRTATQEWDTYKVITEYLKQDARTGGDIHTLLADPRGSAEVDVELEPFAALGHEVASRLGLRMENDGEPGGQETEEPEIVPVEEEHPPDAEHNGDADRQGNGRGHVRGHRDLPAPVTGSAAGRVLLNGEDSGSGFAIADSQAVTAGHVVWNETMPGSGHRPAVGPSDPALVYLVDGGEPVAAPVVVEYQPAGAEPIPVTRIEVSTGLDVAVLHLHGPAPAVLPVARQIMTGEQWRVETWPRATDPALTGTITDRARRLRNERGEETTMVQLWVREELGDYQGYSGSPVTLPPASGMPARVLGVLVEQGRWRVSTQLGQPAPVANVLFAAPIDVVLAEFGLTGVTAGEPAGTIPLPVAFEVPRPAQLNTAIDALLAKPGRPLPGGQLAGLVGMGGSGKSVLAAAVARDPRVREAFPDGLFWLELGPDPPLLQLQASLAAALGDSTPITDVPQGRALLSRLLAERRCLLVLDDVWGSTDLSAFAVAGLAGRVLVTTRDTATLPATAVIIALDALAPAAALQLLGGWTATPAGQLPAEAALAAQECGYLPLALALCGAMIAAGDRSWPQMLDLLRQADLRALQSRLVDYPRSLAVALAASIDTLAPEARDRYMQLAVFNGQGPVPVAAVQALWGLDEQHTIALIEVLAGKSLLRAEDGRVSLHDLQMDYLVRRAADQ